MSNFANWCAKNIQRQWNNNWISCRDLLTAVDPKRMIDLNKLYLGVLCQLVRLSCFHLAIDKRTTVKWWLGDTDQ